MAEPISRRRLVGAAAGVALAPTVGVALAPPVGVAAPAADPETVGSLVRIELLSAFAYEQALRAGSLPRRIHNLLHQLLGHERAHAAAMSAALRRLGGTPPTGPSGVTAADRELAAVHVSGSLEKTVGEHDWLRLLIALERAAEGAYFAAIGRLADAALLRLAAEIMGNEAQHAALLGLRLHHGDVSKAIPDAFVQGTS